MHNSYIGGKGDKRRPEDLKSFEEGFDRVFGKKTTERGRFVWDEQKKTFVPVNEYAEQSTDKPSQIMPDIQPYQSMVTGEIITSRSKHRRHLKDHNMVEVGNDSILTKPHKIPDANPEQRKEFLRYQVNRFTEKEWRRMGEKHRQAVIRQMERGGKD